MPELEQDGFIQALRTASLNFQNGNYASAEPIFRVAVRVCDPNSDETLSYIRNLGEICIKKGNVDEAIRLNMRLLATQAARGASPQVAATMERVASLYEMMGRLDEAEYLHSKAAAVMTRLVHSQANSQGQSPAPENQPALGEIIGPPPPWLMNAFSEADRQYGKQRFEIDPETVVTVAEQPEIQVVDRTYRLETDEPDEGFGVFLPDHAEESPLPAMRPNTPMAPRFAEPEPEHHASARSDQPTQEDRFFGRNELGSFDILPQKAPKSLGRFRREAEADNSETGGPGGSGSDEEGAEGEEGSPQLSADVLVPRRVAPISDKLRASQGKVIEASRASGRRSGEALDNPWRQTFDLLYQRWTDFRMALNRLVEFLRQKKKPVGVGVGICVGLLLLFGVYAYFFWPYPKPAAKTAIGMKFRSADSQKIYELIDDKVIDLSAGVDSARLPYHVYFFDFRNLLSLMLGPLAEKQYWVVRTNEGLIDGDATVLYPSNAPEMSVVETVKSIGKYAADYYGQHRKYPTEINITYVNPFAKKVDKPRMQELTLNGVHERELLYAKLLAGLSPVPANHSGESAFYPGCINCCDVTIHTSGDDVKIFAIQAGDTHGLPISGSTDTSGYFFALEGGKQYVPLQPQLPMHGTQHLRRQVVWLIEEPLSRSEAELLKHGASYIFAALAMFLFVFYKVVRPVGIAKYAALAAVIGTSGIFLFYGFLDYLPF